MASPFEHGLRSALIAVRLGRRLALDEPVLAQIYLVTLLYYVGCTADLDVFSRAVSDEKLVRSRMAPVVFDSPAVMGRAMLAGVAAQPSSPLGRVAAVARALPYVRRTCRRSQPGIARWPACSRTGAAGLPRVARILAAADAYHAMREPRPHREPLPPDHAARALREEVAAGRLDAEAVAAVLACEGHRPGRRPDARGRRLTEQEIEVLRLLATGQRGVRR